MQMKILTYTSSTHLPQTIFTERTLLQNTQTRLSHTHIHFTCTTEINTNCDILAIDASALTNEDLEVMKRRFTRTIVWSGNIVKTVLWFAENAEIDPQKHYIVIEDAEGVHANEREATDANKECIQSSVEVVHKTSTTSESFLNSRFDAFKESKSVERILNRLSLVKGKRN